MSPVHPEKNLAWSLAIDQNWQVWRQFCHTLLIYESDLL